MKVQTQLYPDGLTVSQFNRLAKYANRASLFTPSELLAEANCHVDAASAAYQRNRLVNLRLAMAIRDTIEKLTAVWDEQSEAARPWLAAAILYFSHADDDEPDFNSAIGFEDDVEALNACLRFAELDDLCLNPEDYDGV
ncbi:MAG: hypothetical protein L0Y75_00095 [Acidobacteria bacterium]|nr:hypothetical protein [Acidobacteriota bacterium]